MAVVPVTQANLTVAEALAILVLLSAMQAVTLAPATLESQTGTMMALDDTSSRALGGLKVPILKYSQDTAQEREAKNLYYTTTY